MIEKELRKNIFTFLRSSELVYSSHDFTSATILYFKTLFSTLDYIILKKIGKVPQDHEERFRTLETKLPSLYQILNSIFRIYRSTYRTSITQEECEKVKKHVREIIERYKISETG